MEQYPLKHHNKLTSQAITVTELLPKCNNNIIKQNTMEPHNETVAQITKTKTKRHDRKKKLTLQRSIVTDSKTLLTQIFVT